ncbi:MAG: DUF4058 family protein [Planctomycetes bacterium]|nr:DUF4058 family protein [Planctomycetota bacterium]
MPSPFPGMDPFLEDPSGWLNIQTSFISYLGDELNDRLRGRYLARAGERVVREAPPDRARNIYPEVMVVERRPREGGVATAEPDAAVRVRAATAEFREAYLELRLPRGGRVVTVIEILSPSNKTPGSEGRELYQKRQREVRGSDVHLVEIDLLRAGAWTVAVPEPVARDVGEFEYLVSVNRSTDREVFDLYPIRLTQRLPRIGVPLAGKDPDAVADLQALLDRLYDRGRYAEDVDYSGEPAPPLPPTFASWTEGLLRGRGMRG